MKKVFFSIILAGLSLPFIFFLQKEANPLIFPGADGVTIPEHSDGPRQPNSEILAQKTLEALKFCRENNLNNEAAIFIDLGLHSGYNRCFVVRLSDGSIRLKGLVTHGSGKSGLAPGEREYSNEAGSLLSSLGKYKTGASYNGQFGLAFKLYGLEATNSNAFSRFVVLHGHECVPATETGSPICQSWGCPTVSPAYLLQLQKVINSSPKPMLIWVFDSVKGE